MFHSFHHPRITNSSQVGTLISTIILRSFLLTGICGLLQVPPIRVLDGPILLKWLYVNLETKMVVGWCWMFWLVVWNMFLKNPSYMGCHPSHWRSQMFQDGHIAPPTSVSIPGWEHHFVGMFWWQFLGRLFRCLAVWRPRWCFYDLPSGKRLHIAIYIYMENHHL